MKISARVKKFCIIDEFSWEKFISYYVARKKKFWAFYTTREGFSENLFHNWIAINRFFKFPMIRFTFMLQETFC